MTLYHHHHRTIPAPSLCLDQIDDTLGDEEILLPPDSFQFLRDQALATTKYCFRIKASNAQGFGPWSPTICATTTAIKKEPLLSFSMSVAFPPERVNLKKIRNDVATDLNTSPSKVTVSIARDDDSDDTNQRRSTRRHLLSQAAPAQTKVGQHDGPSLRHHWTIPVDPSKMEMPSECF